MFQEVDTLALFGFLLLDLLLVFFVPTFVFKCLSLHPIHASPGAGLCPLNLSVTEAEW